jgi:hypothetical protein
MFGVHHFGFRASAGIRLSFYFQVMRESIPGGARFVEEVFNTPDKAI